MDKDSQQLANLIAGVSHNLQIYGDKLFSKMELIMATLDDIAAKVRAEADVIDSAIVLINGFKDKLDACVASGADPAVLQKLSDDLGDQTAKLAAAVAANTVAETPPATPAASEASQPTPSAPAVDPAPAAAPAESAPADSGSDPSGPANPPT